MPLLDPSKADTELAKPDAAPQDSPVAPALRRTLADVAISDELATLFFDARSLLDVVKHDPDVPANQKAQVLNSILGVLERITKTRTDLYNAERIRQIEQALLRVMRDQPAPVKEAFMHAYEAALAE